MLTILGRESPELSPAAREGLYAMGFALFTQDRFADAAAVFRIMLRVAPSDERSWLALGECHERAGQREVALELYTAACAALEHAPLCSIARFRALWDEGDTDAALDHFELALDRAEAAGDDDFIQRLHDERKLRS